MEQEIWKYVVGYEGKYQISNLGRVKNIKLNRFKTIFVNEKGYYQTTIKKDGKLKQVRIHQLIAKAFIPNPNNYIEINHIDGNKLNNDISNLEWCSRRHNVIHAYKTGLISKEKINKSIANLIKINKKPIVQLKDGIVINYFDSIIGASKSLGIHPCCILRNLKGRTKITHGFTFKYKEKGK